MKYKSTKTKAGWFELICKSFYQGHVNYINIIKVLIGKFKTYISISKFFISFTYNGSQTSMLNIITKKLQWL